MMSIRTLICSCIGATLSYVFIPLHACAQIQQPKNATIRQDNTARIAIQAASFLYDNKRGIAHYEGDVRVTQGTRQLQSEALDVLKGASGHLSRLVAQGHAKRAHFRLSITANKPYLSGKAWTIHYDAVHDHLILIGHAELTQAGDCYKAPRIEYDIQHDTIRSPKSRVGRTAVTLNTSTIK